jgi:hypothetical protein
LAALPTDDCADPRVGDVGWLDAWLAEHDRHPSGEHDDMVDTTAMALTRFYGAETGSQSGGGSRSYLTDPDSEDEDEESREGRW